MTVQTTKHPINANIMQQQRQPATNNKKQQFVPYLASFINCINSTQRANTYQQQQTRAE